MQTRSAMVTGLTVVRSGVYRPVSLVLLDNPMVNPLGLVTNLEDLAIVLFLFFGDCNEGKTVPICVVKTAGVVAQESILFSVYL